MIALEVLKLLDAASASERSVLGILLDAIDCARADGAPFSDKEELLCRAYFARQRRLRAELSVCVWLAPPLDDSSES